MAEKEYIEKRKLKPLFEERFYTAFMQEKTRENPEFWSGVCAGVNWGLNTIFDEPAADVVEVVRCKDCKHYGTSGCAMDTYAFDVVEECFCSYGERKEATP